MATTPATVPSESSSALRLRVAGWREVFGIDLRTLALFRIGLAVIILTDLALRARDLEAHYTDFGIMPRSVLANFLHPASVTFHAMNGSVWWQAALFCIAAGFALMLLVGYRTRLASIVCWVFLLSLQNRNTMILSGEDNLLILLAFWGMFLPLGARCSIDAVLGGPERPPNRFYSVATLALLIQGMSMYFFSALLKSDAQWIPDGSAVHYALQLDYLVTPFSLWFRQFPELLQGLTYYVWVLELIGPILIFSPIFHRGLRIVLLLAFATMHIGFFLCLEIGLFPFVSILMNLTFLPGWVWDRAGRSLRDRSAGPAGARIASEWDHLRAWIVRALPRRPVGIRQGRIGGALAAVFMAFVFVQNLSTLPGLGLGLPGWFVTVRQTLALYQNWTMFAPHPEMNSPWPVIAGQLRDGTIVDVYNRRVGDPDWSRPRHVAAVYDNYRWRKYLSILEDLSYDNDPPDFGLQYGRYLCRVWNRDALPERRLSTFRIFFNVEWSRPDNRPNDVVRRLVWSHDCFG